MALEQATRHIEQAVKEVEAATSAESRLAASKKCYRAVWELRGALRDVRALGPLRENSAQAKAWDALEALLGARGLVVSEALRFGAREAVVALYGAGDAGGQLYAAARGLHELCGECSTSVLPVAAKKTQNRSSSTRSAPRRRRAQGARGALRGGEARRRARRSRRASRRSRTPGAAPLARSRAARGADEAEAKKTKGGGAETARPPPKPSGLKLSRSTSGGEVAAGASPVRSARAEVDGALKLLDDILELGCKHLAEDRVDARSTAGPSLVGAVGFLAALVARHRRDRSRRGVAGAARAVGALLEREAGALATRRRASSAVLRATLAPLRDDARASQDDDDAAAAARCALGRELRKRLGAAPEQFQRRAAALLGLSPRGGDDAPAVAGPRLGEHELQVALAECSHLATALGDAAAPCGDGLGARRCRSPAARSAKDVRVRMCALHGAATLAATLLRSFDAGAAGPSRALVDEALAVAEGLVMRQFDASLCAANRAAVLSAGAALEGPLGRDVASLLAKVVFAARGRLSRHARAHGRFRLKLVAAGLLEAYAALPPAAFEGDPRAAGRVFDWAVGLVLVAGAALPATPLSDAEAAFAPLPNESLALTSEFPPGIDPASSSATRRPARASATARRGPPPLASAATSPTRWASSAARRWTTASARRWRSWTSSGLPAARVDARLVDAAKNAGRRGARRASAQRSAIDALSRALTHALTPPKSGLMSSEEDRRRRERRHATAAANACAALLAILDALPRTFARVADATADPFGPARTVSTSPLSDAPRDALAKALAAASPLCRRAAAAMAARLPPREPKAKLAAAKALADACGKADAPRSEPDAARAAAAAARAWALAALADAVAGCRPHDDEAKRRSFVALVLDALETQLVTLARGLGGGVRIETAGGDKAPADGDRATAFGLDAPALLWLGISRCVAALAPHALGLRPGPDGPLISRYGAAADACRCPGAERRSEGRAAAAAAHVPALVAAAGLSGGALLDQLALLGDATPTTTRGRRRGGRARRSGDDGARPRRATAARGAGGPGRRARLCLKALDGGLGRATRALRAAVARAALPGVRGARAARAADAAARGWRPSRTRAPTPRRATRAPCPGSSWRTLPPAARGAADAASVVRAACEAFGDAAWLPPAPEVRPEAGGDEAEEDEAKAPRRAPRRAEAPTRTGPWRSWASTPTTTPAAGGDDGAVDDAANHVARLGLLATASLRGASGAAVPDIGRFRRRWLAVAKDGARFLAKERRAGGPYDADAFAGAYFDVGAGACYDGRADAAGVRTALVDALPACCAAAAPRRGAGDDAVLGDDAAGRRAGLRRRRAARRADPRACVAVAAAAAPPEAVGATLRDAAAAPAAALAAAVSGGGGDAAPRAPGALSAPRGVSPRARTRRRRGGRGRFAQGLGRERARRRGGGRRGRGARAPGGLGSSPPPGAPAAAAAGAKALPAASADAVAAELLPRLARAVAAAHEQRGDADFAAGAQALVAACQRAGARAAPRGARLDGARAASPPTRAASPSCS
ncbi:acetylcholine-gated cation-selective channel [Aureococcus anophagefferens]|nr:acetylcholine-gated cation-selective channel [Aureococcus anophagefferens]